VDIIQANPETCTQCGMCAQECPGFIIDFKPNDFPRPMARTEKDCIRCGHCVVVCPTGSLTHREIPVEACIPIEKDLVISAAQCEQLLKSRRSVRVFPKKAVPRETITRLIEIARYAPTGHNDQELGWLVIDSPEELDRIETLGADWIRWNMENQTPLSTIFDLREMLKRQEESHRVFLRGAPVLVITHAESNSPMGVIDSSTALGYLDLAAHASGLGTCWAGLVYFMANFYPPVKAAIALPEGRSAVGCAMLGYNQFKYQRIPTRKEPPITWR
jgi:nitroreductase/NAD-dependent dihydropyrimidine dehydrogenase PreA subunit